ncbi:MAG: DUF1585 domain-containing protein [Myxococcales bacterium]|nr:DUF1585 domain-containing protein [Myxococcales bacterium]MCB9643622.1 DUF1585 domain-containing protein [Myxococcales bacterium]
MRTRIVLFSLLCIGGLSLFSLTSSNAQVCEAVQPQISLQYLRRLSLDLRGRLPSFEELEKVAQAKQVPSEMIDKMIQSPELLDQMEAYHRDLLWANFENLRISNQSFRLVPMSGSIYRTTSTTRRRYYRGGDRTECLNEAAKYDASGNLLCKKADGNYESCKAMQERRNLGTGEIGQEGYVMVAPYWNPNTKIKVCALDAQDAEQVDWGGRTYACETTVRPNCGCGTDLRWCFNNLTSEREVNNALVDQMLRFTNDIIRNNRPYTEIMLGNQVEVNGPISHFLRFQSKTTTVFGGPDVDYAIPEVPYHEKDKWVQVRRSGLHAGILTLPGYLLKFASNRGRANRFYNAFLCQFFQAPPGGLPAANDNCHVEPNLMKRCGCNFCHQAVEPAAAYWGRFAEAGYAPLSDLAKYPKYDANCAKSNARNNATCRRLYFIAPNHPDEERYRGMLLSYLFSDAHPTGKEIEKNIEQGPRLLANEAIQSGKFAACTTRKMWGWFVGTELQPQQEERITKFAEMFKQSGYNLLTLVKALVTSEEYRQGRLTK